MSAEHTPRETAGRIYALMGFVVFVWSLNFIVGKYVLRELTGVLLATVRITMAACIYLPYYLWSRRGLPLLDKGGLGKLLGVGVVGVGINQMCFFLGLSRTSVSHAAILLALTPMTVLLLSAAIGHETITRARIAGLLIAIGGVGFLQLRGGQQREATLGGDLLVLCGMLTFALFTVGGKSLRRDFDGLTLNAFAHIGSAVLLAPVTYSAARRFDFASVSAGTWAALCYMALVPSVIAYMAFSHALRHLPATRVSMFAYIQPVLATLFGVTLLGESVTAPVLAGGALIMAGVLVAERA